MTASIRIPLFLAAVAIGAVVLWHVRQPNPQLERLNHTLNLEADASLLNYPYPFRVVQLDSTTAIMATPAIEPSVTVVDAINPSLRGQLATNSAVISAEKTFMRMQRKARRIILAQPQITTVQWRADPTWLRHHSTSN